MSNNDEREFRLRPRKPPVPERRNEARAWSLAFKRIMHYARMSRQGGASKSGARSRRAVQARFQRCAVRVTYTRNATRGQWRAHGRYLARESATYESDPKAVGFDQAGQGIDLGARLEQWQAAPRGFGQQLPSRCLGRGDQPARARSRGPRGRPNFLRSHAGIERIY